MREKEKVIEELKQIIANAISDNFEVHGNTLLDEVHLDNLVEEILELDLRF